ncbi:MAG: ThuA domain-containing protein [Planctomycetia bacterium]|nr:ThuA domain-containing protein [Planctomycetia bacterium]
MLKRRDFLLLSGLTALTLPWGTLPAAEPKRILYFDMATRCDHEPTVIQEDGLSFCGRLITRLGRELGFEVVCTKEGPVFEQDLSAYAAFVFYTCDDLTETKPGQLPLSAKGEQNLLAAIRDGAGFLGLHSTVWTWGQGGPESKYQSGFNQMLGGSVLIHGDQQETEVHFTEPVQLPSLQKRQAQSVRHFEEWYALTHFKKDIHVIMIQDTTGMQNTGFNECYNRASYPCTWARMEGQGRVAYTSLGHDIAKLSSEFATGVVSDLLTFIVGKLDLDLTPNLGRVCPEVETLAE